jgi:GTP cyclohydrolase FolE2
MKRPDEQYVVERAHRRPRFVEDGVREMVRGTLERLPGPPSDHTTLAEWLHGRG